MIPCPEKDVGYVFSPGGHMQGRGFWKLMGLAIGVGLAVGAVTGLVAGLLGFSGGAIGGGAAGAAVAVIVTNARRKQHERAK